MEALFVASGLAYVLQGMATWAKEHPKLGEIYAHRRRPIYPKAGEHIIDCDVDPEPPKPGWIVHRHQRQGLLRWDPSRIKLHLSRWQRCDSDEDALDLRRQLRFRRVLNANVLDFLLANPHLYPEEWKKRDERAYIPQIHFWGTEYLSPTGKTCVRSIWCFENTLVSNFTWIDDRTTLDRGQPAATF